MSISTKASIANVASEMIIAMARINISSSEIAFLRSTSKISTPIIIHK
tara:strand:+ start:196 stop:339 length:144 start_codon:yes stop_codon:yes gene_type:complete